MVRPPRVDADHHPGPRTQRPRSRSRRPGERARRQRLRDVPRPDRRPGPLAPRRRDVGLVRRRTAPLALLLGRQPRPHLRHPRSRPGLRRPRPPGRPPLLLDRRPRRAHRPAVAAARTRLGPGPRGPGEPAADGHREPVRRCDPRPLGPPDPQGRDGHPDAGLRGDVHRGGRYLPARGRRRTPLPGTRRRTHPGQAARSPGSTTARSSSRPRSAPRPRRPARSRASGWRPNTAAADSPKPAWRRSCATRSPRSPPSSAST